MRTGQALRSSVSAQTGGKLNRTATRVRWSDGRARLAKVALATAAAFALAFGGFALAGQVPVQLGADGPQPETVTVNWSDTVAFTNADSEAHSILLPSLTVTSPDIPPGGTFTQVFDKKKGAFSYVQTGTKRRTGRVIVQIRGELVLKAAPEKVVFRQSAALTGISPYPNSPVVISQRPIGSQMEKELATTTAAEDGSFTASFRPQSGTRVRASAAAGQLRSPFVTVSVAPRVTIAARPTTVKAGRTVTVTGRLAPAGVVQKVHLDRYDAQRKEWARLSTKPVTQPGAVAFRWTAERGRSLLRLSITRADLRPGYVPTISRTAVVRGLTVALVPRLAIVARPTTVRAGHTVTVTGHLTPADAAKRAHLERYDAQRKKWDRLSTRLVSHSGAVVFRWRAEQGRSLLRLRTTRADLEPGYVPTISRVVAVNGLAPDR
jgi:plastocyanin